MAKETFERVKPHVNVGTVKPQVAQLQNMVRGNRQLEALANHLASRIDGSSEQPGSDIPVVPNASTLGFSNVMVGGTPGSSNTSPGVHSQLARLKPLIRDDRESWNIVVLMEAMSGADSSLLAHELTHVAQYSTSPPVRRYAGLLLPAVQK